MIVPKREIKLVNVDGMTPTEIEDAYNNGAGQEGWRIIQILTLGNKRTILAEREIK